jgi:hypothetical protein
MINNSLILTLQGRVSQKILKKINANSPALNKAWFFVDYAVHDVETGAVFHVLLEGENKKLLRNTTIIKLVQVFDEFGHKIQSVPEGYKTICRFEFRPNIPVVLKKLPLLNSWQYNPQAVSLAQQGIEVDIPDNFQNNLYTIAYGRFKLAVKSADLNNGLTKKEFLHVAQNSLNANAENAEKLLNVFMQLGKIKRNNRKLELIET